MEKAIQMPAGQAGTEGAAGGGSRREILRNVLGFLALLILGVLALQRLFLPKYEHGNVEGGMIGEYYGTQMGHSVVFIGDCEVYENISTRTLWEEYGIHAYTRGSANQLIAQSRYLLEETFRIENPRAIVFNVQSLKQPEATSEAYNRMTLDGMRWSDLKAASIRASMMEGEHFADYLFPILRFHARYAELEADDFLCFFRRPPVTHSGYYLRAEIKAAENIPEPRPLANPEFDERCVADLDRMRELCAEHGAELILVKAPSLYPYWYPEWDEQVRAYSEKYGLAYYNFLDVTEEIGLDYAVDTCDAGQHLNVSGAEKLARYFGRLLQGEHGIMSARGDAELEAYWEEAGRSYEADLAGQLVRE